MAEKIGAERGDIKIYSNKRAAMKIGRDHDGDKHDCAVHHGMTHLRFTQTSPFTNTCSFCQSYFVAWHSSIGFADCQPRTGQPTNHYTLNHFNPSQPPDKQLTNVAQPAQHSW
jgi:hypothetical protein